MKISSLWLCDILWYTCSALSLDFNILFSVMVVIKVMALQRLTCYTTENEALFICAGRFTVSCHAQLPSEQTLIFLEWSLNEQGLFENLSLIYTYYHIFLLCSCGKLRLISSSGSGLRPNTRVIVWNEISCVLLCLGP